MMSQKHKASNLIRVLSLKLSVQCSSSCPVGKRNIELRKFNYPSYHRLCFNRVLCTLEAPTKSKRRQANYRPTLWNYDYIQSLPNSAKDLEANAERIKSLKDRVKKLLHGKKEVKEQLEIIDVLQQLGVAYHFKEDIRDALWDVHRGMANSSPLQKDDLCSLSLLFRLLREQGFTISQDVFKGFRDDKGWLGSILWRQQTEELLSLYEASYLAMDGESFLDEARELTTKKLKDQLQGSALESHLRERVIYALDLPLHWRMPRLHARWFIEANKKRPTMHPFLLELAMLDFNILQMLHRDELKQVSRWWNDLGIVQELPFSRDRLVESYLWAAGSGSEPESSSYRDGFTKANCLITAIDDVYDIYGTLDELEVFTDAVDRWDVGAVKQLPDYMKICFLALFNTTNDMAYDAMKKKGLNVIPYLKKAWADLCKGYLVESKWYHHGHKPKFAEYLNNARVTIGGHIALTIACCTSKYVTEEGLEAFACSYLDTFQPLSVIGRLCNDLGTSTAELERGDVPKSVQCCMHDEEVAEHSAREQVKEVIRANWRALNGNLSFMGSPFQQNLKNLTFDLARTAHCVYQYGDGFGKPEGETKDRVIALFMKPITVSN